MSSQPFILSYLPSIVNFVVGIVFVLIGTLSARRSEVATQPARLRNLRSVRIIGFVMIGFALLMLVWKGLSGG